jgi:hypothetical protein
MPPLAETRKTKPLPEHNIPLPQIERHKKAIGIHLGKIPFTETQQDLLIRHGIAVGIWQVQNYDDIYHLLMPQRQELVTKMADIKIEPRVFKTGRSKGW